MEILQFFSREQRNMHPPPPWEPLATIQATTKGEYLHICCMVQLLNESERLQNLHFCSRDYSVILTQCLHQKRVENLSATRQLDRFLLPRTFFNFFRSAYISIFSSFVSTKSIVILDLSEIFTLLDWWCGAVWRQFWYHCDSDLSVLNDGGKKQTLTFKVPMK